MIDIKTFMLVLGIGNIAFAILIACYARSSPANPALQLWQWAKLVQGCAHLLGWLRPDWPTVWLGVAANSTLIVGVMLEAAAYCSFLKFRNWRRALYSATVLALVLYNAARLGGASPVALAVVMSLIIGLLSGTMALVLLNPRNGGSLLQRIIGVNNLLFCMAMALRAWGGISGGGLTLFAPGAVQSFTYLTGYALMIVNGFGFLLLCKEADDRKMALLATVDSLTGLVNRRAFFERSAGARMLASRQRHPIALMMLDLDHFKALNDRFGHGAGDRALSLFAAAAQGTLREPDILARLGGEEFAVTLPFTDLAGAIMAAERIRGAAKTVAMPEYGDDFKLTVSVGVVLVERDEDITTALARADRALYAAKSAGRDRVIVGDPLRARREAAKAGRACA